MADLVTIGPLGPSRGSEAKQVVREVWREHFADHPDPRVRTFLDSDEALGDLDDIESTYTRNGGIVMALLSGDRVVGTGAVLRIDAGTCELKRMFLLPGFRGRGLGRRLAETLIEFARSRNYARMRLASNRRLAASHALYRRLGFEAVPAWEPGGDLHALYLDRAL